MKMQDYRDWRIGVKAVPSETRWSARIEVFEPGAGRGTRNGMPLPFGGRFDTPVESELKAVKFAQEWIDRQLR